MTTKPSETRVPVDFDKFGMPSSNRLEKLAVVSATITRLCAVDEATNTFHRKMVYYGVCSRYSLALAVAANEKAFAAYLNDPRVKALARPPTDESDTLRSLFRATYADPKKASKYFKRIEHLWAKRCPVAAVSNYLQKEGLNDPQLKLPEPPCTDKEAKPAPDKTSALRAKNVKSRDQRQRVDENDPPAGAILEWPGKANVGQKYKLIVEVIDYQGTAATFNLLESPELLGRHHEMSNSVFFPNPISSARK